MISEDLRKIFQHETKDTYLKKKKKLPLGMYREFKQQNVFFKKKNRICILRDIWEDTKTIKYRAICDERSDRKP